MARFSQKLAVVALLSSFFSLSYAPVFADTTIMGGGTTGGVITDLGGATVNANTANYAQIGITGNGNTINWNTMNVGAGKHLDFNFTQAGQVALNKVTGGQMSTFAGRLTTSGEAGRLIISNPAGMLFDKGAVVNANSLVLTTKDVNWDGNLNGRLQLTDNANGLNSSIRIIDNKTSQFVIADDLNIVAPTIEVRQANDFLIGKDTRLITTDGVNFVANSRNIETSIDANNTANTGNVTVFDSKIAFQNSDNGKIYVASRGDIDFQKSTLKNTELNSAKNIKVQGGNMYTNRIDDSKLTAKTSITVGNVNSINNSALKLTDTSKANELQININSNNNNHTLIKNSTVEGRFINAKLANIDSSVLKTVKDMNISKSTVNNSTLNSGFKVIAENTNIQNTDITGKNTMTFDKYSTLDHVTVHLNNIMDYNNPQNSTVHLNDATLINGSEVYSPKICANRSSLDNSKIVAGYDMSIIDAALRNGSEATSSKFIHDRNNVVTRDNSALRVTIENSTLTADSDIKFVDANLDGATVNASNSVILQNVNTAGNSDYSVTINPTSNVSITGAHNFKVKASAADLEIDDSILGNNDLSVTSNLTVKDSQFTSDMSVSNADKLNIKNSQIKGLTASNINNITLEEVNADSVTITNSGDIVVKSSTTPAALSSPTISELSEGKDIVTDYDASVYNSNDFETKVIGNKYAENQKYTHVLGNVNISNTTNVDIINAAIEGDLTTEACSGNVNIITSYVGGKLTADRTQGETSIYQSFTDATKYVPYYMIANTSTGEVEIDGSIYIENERKNFGEEINTTFHKHFNPKGFAASDDEIANRTNDVLTTAKSGKNNSIIITKSFIAD